MAPSNGHLLLPKFWRAARFAYEKATRAVRSKLPEPSQQVAFRFQPAYARINRQPINRVAAIRQSRSRHFSTRAFIGYIRSGLQGECSAYQTSRIAQNVSRLTKRAPFATTLRPNLTGGTLGRTAGGYAAGAGRVGGARYFSHGPAAPAQVINNVSAGVRAFFVSGQKVRFDGVDPITGNNRYKSVSTLQDQAERQMDCIPRTAPGSYIDFHISPTITAIGTLPGFHKSAGSETLNSEGLMDMLSIDFARALKDLAAVLNDLKRLSALGDLPILLQDRSTIRVRFPGCDAGTVETLCDEVGVQRGRIVQDEDFDIRTGADLALLFPFAPSIPESPDLEDLFQKQSTQVPDEVDWQEMMSGSESEFSPAHNFGNEISFEDSAVFDKNPWASSPSGYSSINVSELGDRVFFPELSSAGIPDSTSEYEGIRGIQKFLAECDHAQRR